MQLKARITDLYDNLLVTADKHQGIEVVWPQNDTRTAKVTLSVYQDACREVRPLDRLIKITYGPYLIFKGYIVNPVWNAQNRTVEVNCVDATLKLKHHFHRYGDYAVDMGYPIDGRGMRILIESSVPIEGQLDRGIPGNGIWWGVDSTTHQGARPTANSDSLDAALWGTAVRGTNVWESITNMGQVLTAPDFDFDPIDEEHPPTYKDPSTESGYVPGFLAQLHTADKMQNDRTEKVFFQFGFGTNSAEGFTYEPDGDAVRNYAVEVNPGGERFRGDPKNKGTYHSEESWAQYGIYGNWESAKAKYTRAGLQSRAAQWVRAYAYPPEFFTVDPRPDDPTIPQFIQDYRVGDRIRAGARVGFLRQSMTGRIVSATIKQRDLGGGANVSLECVPDVDHTLATGDDISSEIPEP